MPEKHETHETHDKMSPTILSFFEFVHLPPNLQLISEPFHTLAYWIVNHIESGPERSTALRKLLEAKDCAVRAALKPGH